MTDYKELIERLRRKANLTEHVHVAREFRAAADAIEELCEKLSEKPTGWIPVSERLPEEPFGCLVTVWDTNPVTMDEFENILPYFVGWDGEQWNDGDGEMCPFEVIAWMPLQEPYKEEEE
ncbi:MAG: DUF551 domain-containing protein [Firmicutes bacterium]|nr:DUF551 domain-containing protein [Bacillota bacterium]